MSSAPAPSVKIGFVGLGLMGMGMARNLARAGFDLTVYNRTRSKADALQAEVGCQIADTPKGAASGADLVISMVSDVPDVEAVYFGPGGIVEATRPGLVCIDMGTVGADCVRGVAVRLDEQGVGFVDAPVSGGSWGAEQGTLSIMAGGEPDAFKAARPAFEAMGKRIAHLGPVGNGQMTKLVNQIGVALTVQGAAEGMRFAQKAGLPLPTVIEAVGAGAAGSWSWTNLGPRMASEDYAPGFKIVHLIKDLRLVLGAADSLNIDLPGVRLALAQLEKVRDGQDGGADMGTQALILALA